MPHRPKSKRQKRVRDGGIEIEEREDGRHNAIYIPHINESEQSEDSDSESQSDTESDLDESNTSISSNFDEIRKVSYRSVLDNYSENQSKLEPDYKYEWLDGEMKYDECHENEILLSDSTKKMIHDSSLTQLFELFFSKEIKKYIIESTVTNGCSLTDDDFDNFLGVIILSIVNQRKSERDYWSTDPLLSCEAISSVLSRDKFLNIKSKLKLNKSEDRDDNDRAWKVRKVLQMFRKNIMQFGFFSTALSIDEMMVKFHGRTNLLQFMQNKPERWGIKMWGIASVHGYLFDCDIYCGRGSNIYSLENEPKLTKCALGSRVVMLMIQKLLLTVPPRKLMQYHLYFDNFFTNTDLMVHLKALGLKATGTVRSNRVTVKNTIDNKAVKGSFTVKYEKNSGVNYLTVMDSKPVSILSTAAGTTPMFEVRRFSFQEKKRVSLHFPHAFKLYNLFMGGIDLHDSHCSNLMSCIRAKKWTWPIFLRFIQSSITNAMVMRNLVGTENIGSKAVALEIARSYLAKGEKRKSHDSTTSNSKRNCNNFKKCATRTKKMCQTCEVYLCSLCFANYHENI